MAAYNYYGQNYGTPYMPGYFPQPTMQQTTQNYTPMAQNSIIWISGPMEAQSYPIAPNNAVALWEKTGKTIYLKQADATGKPTLTVYDLVERTQNAQEPGIQEDGKTHGYATKDELGAVVGAVKGLDEIVSSIKADIETMRGDMYGLAGKKKVRKTTEVTDEDD